MNSPEGFLERLAKAAAKLAGPLNRLRPDLERLHRGFTDQRATRPHDYLEDDGLRKAYLASFAVPNAARALCVLRRSGAALLAGDHALDAGAGTGSTALALAAISHPDATITLVDRSESALIAASELFSILFPKGPRVMTVAGDLDPATALPGGPFRTVLAGHVLNELLPPRGRDPGPALALARALADRASDRVVITEPAQRIPSRALCRIREALIASGLVPIGPCTHAAACPVLGRGAQDWCVTDVPFTRPALVREVDRMLGTDRGRLTVSWLVLAKEAPPHGTRVYEVLSEIMPTGKSFLLYLCGEPGRLVVRMPKPPPIRLLRGARVLAPANVRLGGRDHRTGAPVVELAPGDLRPLSDQP